MLRSVVVASLVSSVLAQVYVPGPIEDTPGASLSTVGAGTDGFTTYVVEGVTLAENAASVLMSQFAEIGEVVYACALGVDNQATCSVSQVYDGVTYGYTEPITDFGGPNVTIATASTDVNALAAITSITSSPSSTPTQMSASITTGPRVNDAGHQTYSNIFVDSGVVKGSLPHTVVATVALGAILCLMH
ncbi:MAG: hypothetical protein CYPHOPRED_004375 [Cyphobasidiales sp. Tagirdzhanova-0007]|nr:MAG: hypothetical protein CYPHOPRED_004375 [Cyphobasidiales sp. Tagirdzhanova-0007]